MYKRTTYPRKKRKSCYFLPGKIPGKKTLYKYKYFSFPGRSSLVMMGEVVVRMLSHDDILQPIHPMTKAKFSKHKD